jgi:basic membrane protein A
MRSGIKQRGTVLVLLLVLALVAAACSSDDDAGGDDADKIKTCLVTDLAGVDDQSFNASAWKGVQDAMADGYATSDSFFLESADASDWQPNIDQFVSQGCQHIVTVGFALGEVTAINAQAHTDIIWTMIDNQLADAVTFELLNLPNVRELVYQTDEAAFAAGYLAAGVSKTGVTCVYGGANFPTVSIFLDGFTRGTAHYNDLKGTAVEVKGWSVDAQDGVFTGSFTDMDLARSTAESLFQENCDIILPVGGAINLPAGDLILEGQGMAMVGVDADAFFAMPEKYQSVWLTTVEKAIAPFVTVAVQDQLEGTWSAGSFVGNLANEGVGLAEFHDFDSEVSAELKTEVAKLLDDIKNGVVTWEKFAVG